jgi:hypothetical protein
VSDTDRKHGRGRGGKTSFTPEIDQRIIDGFLEDQEATLQELAEAGFSREVVLDRAQEIGLSVGFIKRHRSLVVDVSVRRCLSCDEEFLSVGPQNRLCNRCRARQ